MSPLLKGPESPRTIDSLIRTAQRILEFTDSLDAGDTSDTQLTQGLASLTESFGQLHPELAEVGRLSALRSAAQKMEVLPLYGRILKLADTDEWRSMMQEFRIFAKEIETTAVSFRSLAGVVPKAARSETLSPLQPVLQTLKTIAEKMAAVTAILAEYTVHVRKEESEPEWIKRQEAHLATSLRAIGALTTKLREDVAIAIWKLNHLSSKQDRKLGTSPGDGA